MAPVQGRVTQADEKEVEVPGYIRDVTLSDAFNAPCPTYIVRYDNVGECSMQFQKNSYDHARSI